MSETEDQKRATEARQILSLAVAMKWLPLLSMVIAIGSLIASISQSYNYRRNIESAQSNLLRAENLKSCRDIIEVFFAFRLKAEETNARAANYAPDMKLAARREMKAHVYRFGALGTYLANFSPEQARERYSALSWHLNAIAEEHAFSEAAAFATKFTEIDALFATLNDDCVRNARFAP